MAYHAIGNSNAPTPKAAKNGKIAVIVAIPTARARISREASDNGDIVVVLLDRDTYESLSDIDLYNVMSDLVEQFAPVYEAHVVETQAAADALFVEEPTEDQQTALDNGYIARLEEGFRIVYVGPLEDSGVAILGS